MNEKIYEMRGRKVMLDEDLAKLYGVKTKVLNQAVKRNLDRFPGEFMFQLTLKEVRILTESASLCTLPDLRSQIVTSRWGGRMHKPFVFTEHGAVMLASALKSEQAVKMSIEVVKAFVRLQQALVPQHDAAKQLSEIRSFMLKQSNKTGREFRKVWRALDNLTNPSDDDVIGFRVD